MQYPFDPGRGGYRGKGKGKQQGRGKSQSYSPRVQEAFHKYDSQDANMVQHRLNQARAKKVGVELPLTSSPLYEKMWNIVLELEKELEKQQDAGASSSLNADQEDETNYTQNSCQELIFFLEQQDLKFQNDPWFLMSKYLDEQCFPTESYKHRPHYQSILTHTSSFEFEHFQQWGSARVQQLPGQKKDFHYSKATILQILFPEDWGLSTLKCREYPQGNGKISYTYWDYIQAFYKVFYFENKQKKHSWWIKVNPEIFQKGVPSWFIDWWNYFGPSPTILPEPFNGLYAQWLNLSPIVSDFEDDRVSGTLSMYFFLQFSIPWIVRWIPEVSHTHNHIPCMKRTFFTKFWRKMIQKQPDGKLHSHLTISQIEEKLLEYKTKQQPISQPPSHFDQFVTKLRMKNPELSSQQIVAAYMKQIQQDIYRAVDPTTGYSPSTMSVDTQEESQEFNQNQFQCLAGESQDPYQDTQPELQDLFKSIEKTLVEVKIPPLPQMTGNQPKKEREECCSSSSTGQKQESVVKTEDKKAI